MTDFERGLLVATLIAYAPDVADFVGRYVTHRRRFPGFAAMALVVAAWVAGWGYPIIHRS